MQPGQDVQCPRTDYGDHRVDLFGGDLSDQVAGSIDLLDLVLRVHLSHGERICAGCGAQDRASARGLVLDKLRREFERTALRIAFGSEQFFKPIANADEFPPEFARRDDGAGDDAGG